MDMTERRAAIVGGGSGIGAATARMLTARGARVAVIDIIPERAHDLAAQLDGAIGIECDGRDSKQAGQAIERVVEAFGGIDILVNSISPPGDVAKQTALATLGEYGGLVPSEPRFSAIVDMSDEAWDMEMRSI